MDASECIRTRRSVRKFLQKPIEFDKIGRILEAGHYAPSPGNLQNWRFIVVTDKDLIKAAYGYCLKQTCVYNASALIIVCSLVDRIERYYGDKGKDLWNIQSVAAATQNMLLEAHNLGLGACWVGAFDEKGVRDIYGIPSSAQPQAIIALGYADEGPTVQRDDFYTVVRFNNYGMPIKDVEEYFREYHGKVGNVAKAIKETGEKGLKEGEKHGTKIFHRIKKRLKDRKEKRQARKHRKK